MNRPKRRRKLVGSNTKTRRPRYAAVTLSVILALVAAACSDDDDAASDGDTTEAPSETPAPDADTTEAPVETAAPGTDTTEGPATSDAPVEGTALTFALPEWPRHLASWNGYSNDGHPIIRNTHEALLNRDPSTNELIPELATAYEQVDEFTWRFTLREGVQFHDGTTLNAEDAAWAIEMQLDPETAYPIRQFFGAEVDAEAVDEYDPRHHHHGRRRGARCRPDPAPPDVLPADPFASGIRGRPRLVRDQPRRHRPVQAGRVEVRVSTSTSRRSRTGGAVGTPTTLPAPTKL